MMALMATVGVVQRRKLPFKLNRDSTRVASQLKYIYTWPSISKLGEVSVSHDC